MNENDFSFYVRLFTGYPFSMCVDALLVKKLLTVPQTEARRKKFSSLKGMNYHCVESKRKKNCYLPTEYFLKGTTVFSMYYKFSVIIAFLTNTYQKLSNVLFAGTDKDSEDQKSSMQGLIGHFP